VGKKKPTGYRSIQSKPSCSTHFVLYVYHVVPIIEGLYFKLHQVYCQIALELYFQRFSSTQVIDQSASGCISSSFKINAWSHYAYGWHIRHQTIVAQISCVEGVSGEYCGVV
jgi:hypothetical protein